MDFHKRLADGYDGSASTGVAACSGWTDNFIRVLPCYTRIAIIPYHLHALVNCQLCFTACYLDGRACSRVGLKAVGVVGPEGVTLVAIALLSTAIEEAALGQRNTGLHGGFCSAATP